MKFILSFFILTVVSSVLNAQVVKLGTGVSISSMPSTNAEFLNEYIVKYYTSVGCDYFEHPYFYLSSEIAYTSFGGVGNNAFVNMTPVKLSESWNYIGLNTIFRVRYFFNKTHLYLGAGPEINILTSNNRFNSVFFSNLVGYHMNDLSYGGKLEMGIAYDYRKMRVGLNTSYLLNIGSVGSGGDSEYLKFRRNAIFLILSIGYKL